MAYESPVDMFLHINKLTKTADKIDFLKSRYEKDPIFTKLLRIAMDPKTKLYTKRIPRWNKEATKSGASFSNMRVVANKLAPLSASVDLPKNTKDNILVGLLEQMEVYESEFLIKIITQTLSIEGLTITNVNKAIPGFIEV